jgi:hypothetical protein
MGLNATGFVAAAAVFEASILRWVKLVRGGFNNLFDGKVNVRRLILKAAHMSSTAKRQSVALQAPPDCRRPRACSRTPRYRTCGLAPL